MQKSLIKYLSFTAICLTSTFVHASTCPTEGHITVLCHYGNHKGISVTGCYNGGLAYLCTFSLKSCADVNNESIQKAHWTPAEYHPSVMRFICAGQGRSAQAEHKDLNASTWSHVAAKASRGDVCPHGTLPLTCRPQTSGLSLIGCYQAGLSYLCTSDIKSCRDATNRNVAKASFTHAKYDDVKLVFYCPNGQTKPGKRKVELEDRVWVDAIRKARD